MRWLLGIFILLIGLVVVGSAESLETGMVRNHSNNPDCLSCHNGQFQGTTRHMTETNDDCLFCHSVETTVIDGPQVMLTRVNTQVGNYACVACHVEQDHMNQEATAHSEMDCTNCHSPHSSNFNHLFVRTETELCGVACHGDGDIGITHPIGEQIEDSFAGQSMSCVSTCHSMHKPQDDKMLQVAYGDLCSRCHPDKG